MHALALGSDPSITGGQSQEPSRSIDAGYRARTTWTVRSGASDWHLGQLRLRQEL
jgi:hypothetical protein